jgi:hypothetical protein
MLANGVRRRDSMNFEDKVIRWIAILILTILTLCLTVILILLIGLWAKESGLREGIVGGIIGAAGGILGGSFTFFGVRSTLKNQNKERFINDFPKKLLRLDEIIDSSNSLMRLFYSSSSIRVERKNNDLFKGIRRIIVLSSEIDGEAYDFAKEIERIFDNYHDTINRSGFLTYNTEDTNDPTIETVKRVKTLNDESRLRLFAIQETISTYRERYIETYGRLTKIN